MRPRSRARDWRSRAPEWLVVYRHKPRSLPANFVRSNKSQPSRARLPRSIFGIQHPTCLRLPLAYLPAWLASFSYPFSPGHLFSLGYIASLTASATRVHLSTIVQRAAYHCPVTARLPATRQLHGRSSAYLCLPALMPAYQPSVSHHPMSESYLPAAGIHTACSCQALSSVL